MLYTLITIHKYTLLFAILSEQKKTVEKKVFINNKILKYSSD